MFNFGLFCIGHFTLETRKLDFVVLFCFALGQATLINLTYLVITYLVGCRMDAIKALRYFPLPTEVVHGTYMLAPMLEPLVRASVY